MAVSAAGTAAAVLLLAVSTTIIAVNGLPQPIPGFGRWIGGSNALFNSQTQNTGANIIGSGNSVVDLIDVNPQVGVGVNLLNEVIHTATGGLGKTEGATNIIGTVQEIESGTNIKGSGNSVIDGIDLSPQVGVGVNLLNSFAQTATGTIGGVAGGALNEIGVGQTQNTGANIIGSGNSVVDLIDVNPQVGVGVNILNEVIQTATGGVGGSGKTGGATYKIGTVQEIASGSNIKGSGNSVVDLIDVNPQLGVGVNLLNSVAHTATGTIGGVAGGALNQMGVAQTQNTGANIIGSGNSVVDLIDVNPQVGVGVNLLNEVIQTATGGVGGLGKTGGATYTIGTVQESASGTNIKGSGNSVVDLIDVNPQVGVGANLLNSVTQTATGVAGGKLGNIGGNKIGTTQIQNSGTNIVGSDNTKVDLIDVSPQVNVGLNLLNSITQTGIGGPLGNNIGTVQKINSGTIAGLADEKPAGATTGSATNILGSQQTQNNNIDIVGSSNNLLSLADVAPQIDLNIDLLNQLTQSGNGAGGGKNHIGQTQKINDGVSIDGDNNKVSTLANVKPQIAVDLQLLDQVKQVTGLLPSLLKPPGSGDSEDLVDCANEIGTIQEHNSNVDIDGDGNTVFTAANISPQINVDLNLLNNVVQKLKCRPKPSTPTLPPPTVPPTRPPASPPTIPPTRPRIYETPLPPTRPPTTPPTVPPTLPPVECLENEIVASQQQNSGNTIVGDGNSVFSGLNVSPQLNLGVNVLNNVVQRVSCKPKPQAVQPTEPYTITQTASGVVGGIGKAEGVGNTVGTIQEIASGTNIKGSGNNVVDVIDVSPQVGVGVNLLNSVAQTAAGTTGSVACGALNQIGVGQTQNTGTNIIGSGNSVVDLIDVNPQVGVGVNILNEVIQTATGGVDGLGKTGGATYKIGTVQEIASGSNIKGSGNSVVDLIDVNPQVGVGVNLLNSVAQPATGTIGGVAGGALNQMGVAQTPSVFVENTGANIIGSGNSVLDLIDVNPQVGVGVNILNEVIQTATGGVGGLGKTGGATYKIGTVQEIASGSNIKGSSNSVVDLIDVNPQVGVGVNLLNSVAQPPTGTIGGVAGGALNQIGVAQTQNTGANIIGSGNSVVDLIDVNPQVGVGVNLLNEVIQTATGGVGGLGKTEGATYTIGTVQESASGTNIKGSGNSVVDLIDVNPQVGVGANLLNSVTQTATGVAGGKLGNIGGNKIGTTQIQNSGTNIVGSDNTKVDLIDVSPQVNVGLNLLNSITQTGIGGPLGNNIGTVQKINSGTIAGLADEKPAGATTGSATNILGSQQTQNNNVNIVGSSNNLLSLADVAPQIDLNIDLLNQLTQSSNGAGGGKNHIGPTQIINDGVSIDGDNNKVSTLANVKPQIAVDLQLLDQVKQVTGLLPSLLKPPGSGDSEDLVDCANEIGTIQEHNSNVDIDGDGNTVFTAANISPQINVDLNLLNNVVQKLKCRPKPSTPTLPPPTVPPTRPPASPPTIPPTRPRIYETPLPPTRPPTTPPTVPPTLPPVECLENEIVASQQQNSGNTIVGDGNSVFSGLNVSPQLNLGLNVLNNVVQRVTCKPTPPTVPPTQPPTIPPTQPPTVPPTQPPTVPPTQPPTVPPTQPPTVPPTQSPTVPPTQPPTVPPPRRCFRRYCRKWRVAPKYECSNNCGAPYRYRTIKL